jgi:hypothetical protein
VTNHHDSGLHRHPTTARGFAETVNWDLRDPKKFAVFDTIRDQITPEDEEKLDQAIDRAVQEVRADTNNAYGKDPA